MHEFEDHITRVSHIFRPGSREWYVALLHDSVEDGILESADVPIEVNILTRTNESYESYIDRIAGSGDGIAIKVKIADLTDNIQRCLGAHEGRPDQKKLRKYVRALFVLTTGNH